MGTVMLHLVTAKCCESYVLRWVIKKLKYWGQDLCSYRRIDSRLDTANTLLNSYKKTLPKLGEINHHTIPYLTIRLALRMSSTVA